MKSLFAAGPSVVAALSVLSATAAPLTVSINPFPYDTTLTAMENVTRITTQNDNLSTVQLDDGIPWQQALNGTAFSAALMAEWQARRNQIGTNPVYLAIAPLAEDRSSWAPPYGGGSPPAWAVSNANASPSLKLAYANYVLRAMNYFQPAYLNIGVEAGDMAARTPSRWPQYVAVFNDCMAAVRATNASLKVGISFSLPLLMESNVVSLAGNVIAQSDYVGISFYPYLSQFYAVLGAAPLPAPPAQWQAPLQWLEQFAPKPVAICETGYSTQPVVLTNYGLNMPGDESTQAAYVKDLAGFATRDNYLFTVFFQSVDSAAYMQTLPPAEINDTLWTYTGFFDTNLNAKPSWANYEAFWLARLVAPTGLRVVQ
jgi:hypothetical protein